MSQPTLRKMRAVDMVKHSKFVIPQFFGVVVELDGKEIGSGAIVWGVGERFYLCLEITDELRRKPVFMVKVARNLIDAAITAKNELFVIEDDDEPTSKRFLEYLGFKPTDETIEGKRILRWHQSY